MNDPARRTSWWVVVVGGGLFVVLAVVLVPWNVVPGGPLKVPPASSLFNGQQIHRSETFSHLARIDGRSALAVSLVVSMILGFTPLGARLMRLVRLPWWAATVVGCAALLLIGQLVTLPFSLLLRKHEQAYGLSTQRLAGYLGDLALSWLIQVVATAVVLLVVIACARRWSRAWPAVAGTIMAALVLAASFAYPVVVEPLFNQFHPMEAGPLRSAIFKLADKEGVPIDDVLVVDASRRTTTLNAYVSGFGDTRRVVLYDNLINDLPRREVLSVVGHELGHAKHNDVLSGSVLGAAGAVFGIGLLGLVVGSAGVRRRTRTQGMSGVAVVPLALALSAVGMFLVLPLQNSISREIETRADIDALIYTRDPASFIAMQQQLAVRGLSDPTPAAWSQFWFGSHPTALQRVAVAKRIDP